MSCSHLSVDLCPLCSGDKCSKDDDNYICLLLCPLSQGCINGIISSSQHRPFYNFIQHTFTGTSLAVQWLRLHAPNAVGMGSIPGQGTKIVQAA